MLVETGLLGLARIEILGAEPELLVNRGVREGLRLWKIRRVDGCTFTAATWERDLPALEAAAADCGCEIRVRSLRGGSRGRALFRARRVLLAALLLAALLLGASSLFLWEIRVVGCEKLSEGQVLRALADCGVERGSFWPGISADLVRSRVLTELPEIAWMTVNVSGSRAVVLVTEREEKPEIVREDEPADIRAKCAGVITGMTVLNGRPMVQPGDAVLEGEVLVSGSMESVTAPTRAVRAMGEIRAETRHELTAVCPLEALQIREPSRSNSRFALQIRKKRVNLGFFHGKGLDECDKIMHEYNLGIKGLFALPVTLIREERHPRRLQENWADREEEMKAALLKRLQEQIDGEILSSEFAVSRADGLLTVTLVARCSENIAETAPCVPPG